MKGMLPDSIQDIIKKSASGTATTEELKQLNAFLQEASYEQTNDVLNKTALTANASHDLSETERNIERAIAPQQPSLVIRMMRWSAAAVFLIAASYTVWMLNEKKEENSNAPLSAVEKRYHNDVAPGTDKAVLTTADGNQFLIDKTQTAAVPEGVRVQNGTIDFQNAQTASVEMNALSIPRAAQYKLVLSDGTKVWLNAETTLKFPSSFAGSSREVELTGEAYFEVAKNPNAPFIVRSGDMQVRVLGTHFNVNAYDKNITTTLAEGSVELGSGENKTRLVPGKKGTFVNGSFTVKDADVDADLAWKNGFFLFNQTDMRTIMRQFERWYDIDVVYQPNVPERVFVGELKRNLTLSQALKILELSGIHFTIEGKKITVLNK